MALRIFITVIFIVHTDRPDTNLAARTLKFCHPFDLMWTPRILSLLYFYSKINENLHFMLTKPNHLRCQFKIKWSKKVSSRTFFKHPYENGGVQEKTYQTLLQRITTYLYQYVNAKKGKKYYLKIDKTSFFNLFILITGNKTDLGGAFSMDKKVLSLKRHGRIILFLY